MRAAKDGDAVRIPDEIYGIKYWITNNKENVMRKFATGATRDDDTTKADYEGFLSPLTIIRYGEYMNAHRKQADGAMRDSDNWQKGIPLDAYMKSLFRHVIDLWTLHRGLLVIDKATGQAAGMEDALCAIIFNASGYLHELKVAEGVSRLATLEARVKSEVRADSPPPKAEAKNSAQQEECSECSRDTTRCPAKENEMLDETPCRYFKTEPAGLRPRNAYEREVEKGFVKIVAAEADRKSAKD